MVIISIIRFRYRANSLVHYDIPRFRLLGNKFGFSYNIDVDYLFNLSPKILYQLIPEWLGLMLVLRIHIKKGRNLNMLGQQEKCTKSN